MARFKQRRYTGRSQQCIIVGIIRETLNGCDIGGILCDRLHVPCDLTAFFTDDLRTIEEGFSVVLVRKRHQRY